MHNHQHYVPILKWKQGEYQALFRLQDERKRWLTPLIELTRPGHDFETGRDRKIIDQHLEDFGARLKAKWGSRRCFVDPSLLPKDVRMRTGAHFIKAVFEDLRANECNAVPVFHLGSDAAACREIAGVATERGIGACLRLSWERDFDTGQLSAEIEGKLNQLRLAPAQTDLILDLAASDLRPIKVFARTLANEIRALPYLNRWRSLTVAGSAFPSTFADVEKETRHPRTEWLCYQELVKQLDTQGRIPAYGDYGAAHPDLIELDMRMIKPFAKIRYTTSSDWHLGKGTNVRRDGFEQFRNLCRAIVSKEYFDGPGFSAGDEYIFNCARGAAPTGNLSTWVWVAMNRHMSKVVDDLSSFHGL